MRPLLQILTLGAVVLVGSVLVGPVRVAESTADSTVAEDSEDPPFWFTQVEGDVPAGRVAAAYQSIPHRQTTFRASVSRLEPQAAVNLETLFRLVDLALVQRVETLQALFSGHERIAEYRKQMASIKRTMQTTSFSKGLIRARDLILEALEDQARFLERIDRFKTDRAQLAGVTLRSDKDVRSANRKLIAAYQSLVGAYAAESEKNKQAFFDHLCALDFI